MADGNQVKAGDKYAAVAAAYAKRCAADVEFLQTLTAASGPGDHLALRAMLDAHGAGDAKKLHALMRRYVAALPDDQRTAAGPIDTPEIDPA